ncbi:MAG: hypothetical protein V3U07_03525 [Nitrospirales bacterium]
MPDLKVNILYTIDSSGSVEKVRQRCSRPVVVLTYSVYAPRANSPAALLDGPF